MSFFSPLSKIWDFSISIPWIANYKNYIINVVEAAIMQTAKVAQQMARWVALCVYELKQHQIVEK